MSTLPITDPGLQVWNRLEPRPRHENFDRSLRAEVRDALWMLTRQWQLGELNAEDTGSAVFARVEMETTRIDRLSKKGAASQEYDGTTPLESDVEELPVEPDLLLRLDLGRQFFRVMQKVMTSLGDSASIPSVKADLLAETSLQYSVPSSPTTDDAPLFSNPELLQCTTALASTGKFVDGYAVYVHLKTPGNVISDFLSSPNTNADAGGQKFVEWFERVYTMPASTSDSAWHESHLEYQFACSAPKSESDFTVLSANEYYQGRLDWYSFDIERDSNRYDESLTSGDPDADKIVTEQFTVLPSEIIFGGMPAARYWEMEDRQINFGGMDASTTDTARLLLAEFGLIYSNDWMMMPYDVPVGSICNVKNIVVTDTFGQMTIVRAAGAGSNDDWQRWAMYTLNQHGTGANKADVRLFVPPVISRVQESEAVESVTMARDEMANMVWGVETTIHDGVDGGENGFEAGQRFRAYVESFGGPTPPTPAVTNTAAIKYNIMSSVPENWIPFVPVRLGTFLSRDIQLQRAAMPRVINGVPVERVRPRTNLLRTGLSGSTWSPYYIYEEEVPRSGAIVSTTWQRARWHNGKVVLWLGRRKQNGRGEGNSSLRFDYLSAK